MTRIEREKITVRQMMEIFCHDRHKKEGLCEECSALLNYAHQRLDHCKFGENKTTCKKCPVHCYKQAIKEKMCEVMRYAGPRMIWHHPIEAIRHLINGL